MSKTEKCEARIEEELKGRIEDINGVLNADDPIDELNNLALGISQTVLYKLELSTGGPQDYFTFEYDPEAKEVVDITYHFLDWWDGAERVLSASSEEFKLLERLFNECIKIE